MDIRRFVVGQFVFVCLSIENLHNLHIFFTVYIVKLACH